MLIYVTFPDFALWPSFLRVIEFHTVAEFNINCECSYGCQDSLCYQHITSKHCKMLIRSNELFWFIFLIFLLLKNVVLAHSPFQEKTLLSAIYTSMNLFHLFLKQWSLWKCVLIGSIYLWNPFQNTVIIFLCLFTQFTCKFSKFGIISN